MAGSIGVGALLMMFGPGALMGTAVALSKAFAAAHDKNEEIGYQLKLIGVIGGFVVLAGVAAAATISVALSMPAFGLMGDMTLLGLLNLVSALTVYMGLTGRLS